LQVNWLAAMALEQMTTSGIIFDTYYDKLNAFEYFVTPLNEQWDAKMSPPPLPIVIRKTLRGILYGKVGSDP
jgi:hypothetical protein